jgi:hypothetical protein
LQNLFVVQEQQDKNDLSAAKAISSENASNTATTNVATLTASQFNKDGSVAMTGDINANNNKIKNLADPTNAQDGVTKAYLERTGSITSTQIEDGTIVDGDINASANIAGSKLQAASGSNPGSMSSTDKTKLDTIETSAKDDQTGAEIKGLYEGESNTNAFTDAEQTKLANLDLTKLQNIEPNATQDQTAGEIKTLYESNSNTNALTDAEKAVIDGVTANTSELNKLDGFTGSVDDLNEVVTGKNVVETITGSATDAQIPTAQAVNERVVELVTEVGGFHPIANETSFPTTNPDINDGAGTIVSLKALTSSFSTGSGVTTHTFTNGAGAGNNVIINGLPSNTTFQAGKGLLLETTNTLHTYTYHRLVLDESGVSNADALVSNFNERYYGPLAGNPNTRPSGADRQNGDLYFNQSDGKMKVFNGSHASGTWDDVAAPGNFFINTLSSSSNSGGGSATFNGIATRFTLSSPPNEAQQLLVSINGVIQKPNAGTSPSEGFAISGADIIFASAPPSGSSYFIVTIGSSVNIGTPSNDTVDASKIIDGSIGNAEISNSAAIAGTKISPDFGSQNITTTGFITSNDITISDTSPTLNFTDTNHDSDFKITNDGGLFKISDRTNNNADRLAIHSSGEIDLYGHVDIGAGLDVTGNTTFQNGNRTLDLTLADNPATGNMGVQLRAGAADYLGLAAGGGTGIGIVIDSSNNVGIGLSNPAAELDIAASVEDGTGTLAEHGIRLSHVGATDEEVIPITGGFVTQTGRVRAGIGFISKQASSTEGYAGAIGFYTRSAADGTGLLRTDERMRINQSGNVGIGTSTPDDLLELSSSTADKRLLLTKASSGTANESGMTLHFQNYGPAATGRNDGTLIGRIRFSASQPTSGGLQDAGAIECRADGTQTGNNTRSRLSFLTVDSQTAIERMRLDKDGRLLINTTTLSQNKTPMLEVKSDSNTSADFAGVFSSANGTSGMGISYSMIDAFNNTNNATLRLRTNGGDAVHISDTQNVGIGTTNPGQRLEVRQTSASHAIIACNRPNSDTFAVALGNNSANNGVISVNNSDLVFGRDFSGTFTERMRMRNDGGLCFNGDNAADNALDDYEEGTFTATCANNVTLHSDNDLCMYTKVGRLVTVRGQIRVNSVSGTQNLVINNLPFVNASGGDGSASTVGAVRIWDQNIPSDAVDVVTEMSGGSSSLNFWVNRDNTGAERMKANTNAYAAFTITYFST